MREPMSDCACGGGEAATPTARENPPGLPTLAYRIGTHGRFKRSMLAALARQPALRSLTTRADDDPAIALLDAAAVMLDVLAFYQERIANEGFLRTADERRSLLELARGIGYELGPGVAAGTYLAFELETAPGAPESVVIEAGSRVQSVPGPGEAPQTFETVETIEARAAWNALEPQRTARQTLSATMETLWLAGTATGLAAGDTLLIAGPAHEDGCAWAVRRAAEIRLHATTARTCVKLEPASGTPGTSTLIAPGVWALRVRTAPFGHNAPKKPKFDAGKFTGDFDEWALAAADKVTSRLTLDGTHDAVVAPSWVVIERATAADGKRDQVLRRATAVKVRSRADYGMAGRVKDVTLDEAWMKNVPSHLTDLREVVIYAADAALEPAAAPLTVPRAGVPGERAPLADEALAPLEGDTIPLATRVEGLHEGQVLVVRGKRMRARATRAFDLRPARGAAVAVPEDAALVVLEAPDLDEAAGEVRWWLRDARGTEGEMTHPAAEEPPLALIPAADDDPLTSETVVLAEGPGTGDEARTVLTLEEPLARCYDRGTVTISANVAFATHGESKREVLGSGDGSKPFQTFALRQHPLTYVPAATASGGASTLEVRVNDVLWQEVASLYGRPAGERSYMTRRDDDGTVHVAFGDGANGARLPSGSGNVVASYRVGTGLGGNVAAGRLDTLLTRPLGVKGVTNPVAASGAMNPEARDQARRNAPLTMLTLERIVSLRDYEDFARAFSGIVKARAERLRREETALVHVTLAAEGGGEVEAPLLANLRRAIAERSDPHQTFVLQSCARIEFGLAAGILVDTPRHLPERVLPAVRAALLAAFTFDAATFTRAVSLSEVVAVMQGVDGVVAVDLKGLHPITAESPSPIATLRARRARWRDPKRPGATLPAELLTIDPNGIELGEMAS